MPRATPKRGAAQKQPSPMDELRAEIRDARAVMTALKSSDVDLRGKVLGLEQRLSKVEVVLGRIGKGEEPTNVEREADAQESEPEGVPGGLSEQSGEE